MQILWQEDCGDDIDIYIGDVFTFINNPPGAPNINGRAKGTVGKEYDYDFTATDPDGDDVSYFINWGDTVTEWISSAPSNTPATMSHTWIEEGNYIITVKAREKYGSEGPESSLSITLPRNKAINRSFLNFLQNIIMCHPNLFPILQRLIVIRLGLQ